MRVSLGSKDPEPVAISFGYPNEAHLWSGMLDYNPYIILNKVIRVYRKHGKEMFKKASQIL